VDCPSCGAHNIQGAENCVNCGTDLTNIVPTTQTPEFMREHVAALKASDAPHVGPTDPVSLPVRLMER